MYGKLHSGGLPWPFPMQQQPNISTVQTRNMNPSGAVANQIPMPRPNPMRPVNQPAPVQQAPGDQSSYASPELADALMRMSQQEADSPWEAVGNMAAAYAGRKQSERVRKQEEERAERERKREMEAYERKRRDAISDYRAKKGIDQEFAAPDKDAPDVKSFYDDRTGQEYKAQWNPTTRQWERVGGSKASSNGITIGPDGTVQIGGPAKLTEGQSKDTNYFIRGSAANETLSQLDQSMTNLGDNLAAKVPGGNYLKSRDFQLAEQAGQEFLAVILRKDTGAAVTPQEWALYGPMFIPEPGDQPEEIAQKRTARTRALEAIKAGLGNAQSAVDGQPATRNPSVGGPQPGAVEDGYRFKGGDPADPNAWEPES